MSSAATVGGMTDLPPDIQARREVEDRAAQLGAERSELENKAATNIDAILDLLHDAEEAGIPLDQIARLVGVSRQTLYRWREVARHLAAD
jgi:transcriptional regulator GlxA family with amidase domain